MLAFISSGFGLALQIVVILHFPPQLSFLSDTAIILHVPFAKRYSTIDHRSIFNFLPAIIFNETFIRDAQQIYYARHYV